VNSISQSLRRFQRVILFRQGLAVGREALFENGLSVHLSHVDPDVKLQAPYGYF
jgi:hypothetical protein